MATLYEQWAREKGRLPPEEDEEERKRRQRMQTVEKRSKGIPLLAQLVPFGTQIVKLKRGEKITPQELGVEAGLSALPFGIGKIAKVARGAKAIKGGLETAEQGGRLAETGQRLVGKARGITPAAGVTSIRKGLTTSQATRYNQLASEFGLKGGPARQLRDLEAIKTAQGRTIDELVDANNARLPAGTIANLKDRIVKRITRTPGVKMTKDFQSDLNNLKNAKSVKSLNNQRRLFDNMVRSFDKPVGGDTAKASFAKVVRQEIDSHIANIAPDLKAANLRFSDISEIEKLLQITVARGKGASRLLASGGMAGLAAAPYTGGVSGLAGGALLAGAAATSPRVQMLAGRGLIGGGRLTSKRPVRIAAGQVGVRLPFVEGGQPLPTTPEEAGLTGEILPSDISQVGMETGGLEQELGGFEQPTESPLGYSSAELFQGAMRALMAGDRKAADDLMGMAEFASQYEADIAKQFGPKKMTTTQEKVAGKVADAESIANQIESTLAQAGGGQGWAGFATQIGAKLPGVAPTAKAYEAIRKASIGPLARAISGEVGVLTDRDIARAEALLPKLSDTPEEARLKLQNLRAAIEARRRNVQSFDQFGPALPVSPSEVNFSQEPF